MNAALGGAKDGEGRASAAELIFGDLIDSHESARQTAGEECRPVYRVRRARTKFSKIKQRSYLV
jgi:hypothetical protein